MKAIVNNSTCRIVSRELLTRGTVGKTMEAEFSADWEDLAITATFEAGDEKRDEVYTGEPIVIPHEVLTTAGVSVMLGFQGALPDGTIVKRTEKEWLNNVSETLDPAGVPSSEPTPDWAAQVQTIALEAKEAADSVRSDAQAGKFNGSAGDDGGWYTPAITQPDVNTIRMSFTPSKEGMPAVKDTDIALPSGGGGGGSGEDGGYYTPVVTQPSGNTMQVSFTPSKAAMPAVDRTKITLPAGPAGSNGKKGDKGADGKSAYAYAVEGGYTGTEAEFAAKLAAEKFANPNALTFTGAVTGSYDGSAPLEVEIPSGGGGLTVTNTAAVGQTVKITAVDENGQPTEWESVDFSSGGDAEKRVRHIATVSVTAGTTSYNVTVDSNGDALNLESVYILTNNFWGNNGSYVQVSINGRELTRAYGASGSPQALALEKMGELQKFTNIPKPSNVGISFGDYYNGKSAVTSVGFWSAASTVNTTIEIYGVDA